MDTGRGDALRVGRGGRAIWVGLGASALGAAGAGALVLLAMACGRHVLGRWEAGDLDGLVAVPVGLEALAVTGTGVVAAWLAALVLVGAVASLPGRAAAPLRSGAVLLAPRLAPRVSAVLVSIALATVPAGAAQADPLDVGYRPSAGNGAAEHPGRTAPAVPEAPEPAPEPGWRPTAPPPSPDPLAITLVSRGGADPDTVVVRAGDTLWDIAARHLGADADAAAIAAAWPRWYDANREVIGPDPDHILPGTHLVPPGSVRVAP